jgi:GTPase
MSQSQYIPPNQIAKPAQPGKNVRRRIDPTDTTNFEEIVIAMVGNVDSGKSTLTGVLTTNKLDDGNGLARKGMFVHKHERETGRTTDIAWQPVVDQANKRVTAFVDLAGHENYIKTTASGLTLSRPDFAIICVSDKITRSTKEHLGMCIGLGIDFMVVFTKTDFIPAEITKALILTMKKIIETNVLKKFFQIKEQSNFAIFDQVIPYICISSKTGENLDLVRNALLQIKKKQYILPEGLVVEQIFHVPGIGVVVSGLAGLEIKKGDNLLLGPDLNGNFTPTRIRSIHNDYRYEITSLPKGVRGCLAIQPKVDIHVKRSMILAPSIPNQVCKKFIADVKIYHHPTTINPGYNVMMHVGALRQPCILTNIYPAKTAIDLILKDLDQYASPNQPAKQTEIHVQSGQQYRFVFMFQTGIHYLTPGRLIFREGSVRGVGEVVFIIKYT